MVLALCFIFFAAAETPAHFTVEASWDVWDVAHAELNGDGVQDLLLVTCDGELEPPGKRVEVVLSEGGGYGATPGATLELPAHIGALFLAEVNGGEPKELVAAHAEGADVYAWKGGKFEPLGKQEFVCLLPTRAKEPVFLKDAATDLDGDGLDEWLLPVPSGYSVRNAREELAEIECDVVSEIRRGDSTYVYTRLPAYQTFDVAGSETKGLAFLSDEYADFAQGKGWKEQTRFKVPLALEEKWEASAKMADINNDGFPDLMVTQTKGTVNLQSVTQVYIASAPFQYPSEAAATFNVKGAVASPSLVDVDGDEFKDAIVISVPFGAKNLISFFVRGKISVEAEVYLFKDGKFGAEPAYRSSLTLEAPDGREQVAHALEDFNGDGHVDLAFSTSGTTLGVHAGGGESFVASKPFASFELPAFGTARAVELNEGEAWDIVLFHPGGDNRKRVDIMVF